MKRDRLLLLAGLGAYAAFIWLRDGHWMTSTSDTVPILAALPLFWYLGGPWRWRTEPPARGKVGLAALSASLALLGTGLDLTLLLALSWCGLLCVWLEYFTKGYPRRLLVLPLFAFPWLGQDIQSLGWLFRLSGAMAAEGFFRLLGLVVERQGVMLLVEGMPLSIDPACAGLNVLQALFIAGIMVVYQQMEPGRRYWLALLALAPLAWTANVIRILALGLSGLSFGADFAMGWFHTWGGWMVLCVMFGLCQTLLALLHQTRLRTPAPAEV